MTMGAWAPAVAMLAAPGPEHAIVARALVQDVYERLGVRPDWAAVDLAAPLPRTTHPFTVDYPAAVAARSPNYWPAPKRHKRVILYVVIHDTESSCASALNTLTNPWVEASAHFLVCRDGRIYQLVHVADSAWHAGNEFINLHSIGIEHEGYAGDSYTRAQYLATASLLLWINAHMHLHLQWTRNAVFGHENVPGANHVDPGVGWDWPYFMSLLRGGSAYDSGDRALAVVVWPRAYIHSCASVNCAILGTANWGEQFYVRARRPHWVGIDFAGYAGWMLATATGSGQGTVVRLKARHAVYVRAAADKTGDIIGLLAPGQAYVSTLIDHSVDRHGWWLIEYAHRYGYVCACETLPGSLPKPRPTITPPTKAIATPTMTARPTRTALPTVTATATLTPTPLATATSTMTATPTLSATMTVTPTLSATPTPPAETATPAMGTATPVMGTATPTGTPAPPAATATATTAPTATPTPQPAGPPLATPTPAEGQCRSIC